VFPHFKPLSNCKFNGGLIVRTLVEVIETAKAATLEKYHVRLLILFVMEEKGKKTHHCNICKISSFENIKWLSRHQVHHCLGQAQTEQANTKRHKTIDEDCYEMYGVEKLKTDLQLLKVECGLDNAKMNRIVELLHQASRIPEIRKKELSMNYRTVEADVVADMDVTETTLETINVRSL
jgi:hypothetical protein